MENALEEVGRHQRVFACGGRGVGAEAVEVAFLYEDGESVVWGRGIWVHVAPFYGE
ncbi:hypothetical protein P3L51_30325 [Streptomyces sp. PSRA5]|uniref:hypothetical protein n=1 Tax=Streptomyces panacea TaxID=3035064 RepID=UPI00339C2A16